MKKLSYLKHIVSVVLILLLPGCITVVTINSPLDGEHFDVGEEITFNGSATSSGEELTGDSLVWTSDIDGQIGTGNEFTRDDLSEGTHIITLIAKSPLGIKGKASITIHIGDGPPPTSTTSSIPPGFTSTSSSSTTSIDDVTEGTIEAYYHLKCVSENQAGTQVAEKTVTGLIPFHIENGTLEGSGKVTCTFTGHTEGPGGTSNWSATFSGDATVEGSIRNDNVHILYHGSGDEVIVFTFCNPGGVYCWTEELLTGVGSTIACDLPLPLENGDKCDNSYNTDECQNTEYFILHLN